MPDWIQDKAIEAVSREIVLELSSLGLQYRRMWFSALATRMDICHNVRGILLSLRPVRGLWFNGSPVLGGNSPRCCSVLAVLRAPSAGRPDVCLTQAGHPGRWPDPSALPSHMAAPGALLDVYAVVAQKVCADPTLTLQPSGCASSSFLFFSLRLPFVGAQAYETRHKVGT